MQSASVMYECQKTPHKRHCDVRNILGAQAFSKILKNHF